MSASELLFVTQVAPYVDGPAGVHGVLDQAATAVAQLAEIEGLVPRRVDDVRTLAAAEVAGTRVLVLFTIGETPWTDVHRSVIHDRLRAGTLAIVAIHSASDSCYSWPAYGTLVGARFDGHPWTQALDIDVVVRDHPATAHLGPTWRWTDEVYQFRELRPDATVLLRAPLDQLDLAVAGADPPAFGYPLAWCHREGQGSVFATALGHFPAAWESPTYLRHVHGGLRWALTASEPQGA